MHLGNLNNVVGTGNLAPVLLATNSMASCVTDC